MDDKSRNSRTIIFPAADEKLFMRVCRRYPLVPQHRVAQILLRCGLRIIALDPERLVEEAKELPGELADAKTEVVKLDGGGATESR